MRVVRLKMRKVQYFDFMLKVPEDASDKAVSGMVSDLCDLDPSELDDLVEDWEDPYYEVHSAKDRYQYAEWYESAPPDTVYEFLHIGGRVELAPVFEEED